MRQEVQKNMLAEHHPTKYYENQFTQSLYEFLTPIPLRGLLRNSYRGQPTVGRYGESTGLHEESIWMSYMNYCYMSPKTRCAPIPCKTV